MQGQLGTKGSLRDTALMSRAVRRLLLYAHYNASGRVEPYVIRTLTEFASAGYEIVVCSTSEIRAPETKLLRGVVKEIVQVPNIGYDFFAWKMGLESVKSSLAEYDRLVLLNSSVVGPVLPMGYFLRVIESREGDIIGATMSNQLVPHIQSYFQYVKTPTSTAFHSFWDGVVPIPERWEVINRYELKMMGHYIAGGLTVGAFYQSNGSYNPTIRTPYRLLMHGFPFVKVQLLRENPRNINLWFMQQIARRTLRPAGLSGFH